jgi:hypothetical protein
MEARELKQPIKITEDRLMSLGFDVDFKLRGVTIYSLDKSGITLQLTENGTVSYVSVGIQRIDDGSLFKYIYHIQDLYHALTRKELTTIK